jgi:hypothetical protein
MDKVKDNLAAETDAGFFDNMRKMERDTLTKLGDKEALAILDEEERQAKEEIEKESK